MRVLTPIFFVASLLAAAIATPVILLGCGPNAGTNAKKVAIDTGLCAAGKVPADAVPLLTDLVNSVNGSPDAWENATSVAINAGVDVAECLYAALVHVLSSTPSQLAPGALEVRNSRLADFKAKISTARAKRAAERRSDLAWLSGMD